MKPKYILHPGIIDSLHDGDRHMITAQELADLYNVKLTECIIEHSYTKFRENAYRNMVHLYPRINGNYSLNEVKKGT